MPLQISNVLANKFPTLARLPSRSYDITLGCLPSQLYAEENSLQYLTQFVDSDPSFANWAAWLLHVLGRHPMFWRLPRNLLASSVRLWPVQNFLNTHLVPILQPPFMVRRKKISKKKSKNQKLVLSSLLFHLVVSFLLSISLSLSSFSVSLSLSPCDVVCDVVCGSACGVCGVCPVCGVARW